MPDEGDGSGVDEHGRSSNLDGICEALTRYFSEGSEMTTLSYKHHVKAECL